MLFHYCSIEAFFGIIQNKSIWASNYKFLNDYQEIYAAKNLIEDNIDRIENKLKKEPNYKKAIEELLKSLNMDKDIFIASLSTEKDLLSQWRAYANNGEGICFGFNANKLTGLNYPIVEVIYEKGAFFNKLIQILITYLRKDDWSNFHNDLDLLLCSYKTKDFREEKEKRLVVIPNSEKEKENIKFRVSGSFIVPYISIDLCSQCPFVIKEIWTGPSQKDRDVKASIMYFLDQKGFSNVKIKSSNASYRN